MSADDYKLINETVGLYSAVALLVGTALGMAIFIVPTQMAAEAGPSISVAVFIAMVPMVLNVLMLLQLGGAIPVAGGIYVYCSRLVGPLWGLIGVAVPVIAIWSFLLFAALGFDQYLPVLIDILPYSFEIPQLAVVWFLLISFLFVNYLGIQIAAKIQLVLVTVLVAGLMTFILFAFANTDPSNFTPLFPDGPGEPFETGFAPFLLAIVLLHVPFQGFSMIIEIGEELENPVKNIPRTLAIGMTIVSVLSVGIVIALIGAVPWQELITSEGEVIEGGLAGALQGIAPTWAIFFIAVSALIGAVTTVNTLFTSYSRTIMRAARDGVAPEPFAEIHDRFHTPHRSILAIGFPPILMAPFVNDLDAVLTTYRGVDVLDWLVVVIVSGIFIAVMVGGVALWNLPKIFPKRYEYSIYKLPMPVLKFVAVGNVIASIMLLIMVASGAPTALAVVLGWILLVAVGYFYRVRKYEKRGVDIREKMSLLHEHEQIGGSNTDD
ncbi:MAG: amino acid permease [Halobacteriales archaeon]|nr:amino acid permease [Halobacteriales archaeon]